MNVNRRYLYWGVFFVTLGAVLLAGQAQGVDEDLVAQALRLWPVLVIALGVGLLLRLTRFSLAGGMLAAAVPGLVLGGMLVAGPVAAAHVGPVCTVVKPTTFSSNDGYFVGDVAVGLKFRCGDVTVTTSGSNGWNLEAGNSAGLEPVIDATTGRLLIQSSYPDHPFGFAGGSDTWRLRLPVDHRLDFDAQVEAGRGWFDFTGADLGIVELVVNAGETTMNLEQAILDRLTANVNAGSASFTLPDDDFTADLTVNAGALRLCAPDDLGLRIRQEGAFAGTTYDGLVRSGDTWESPDYATATHHADVTISANVAGVEINPIGGCK